MKGLKDMLNRVTKFAEKYPDEVKAALYQEGQIIMTESKRLCPVDRGKLRASGQVSRPEQKGKNITVTLSYGGAAAPYAIYVHENLTANHASPPFGGGQAKFLEQPLFAARAHLGQNLATRLHFDKVKV